MRSKLFVPAARPDFFSKALRGDADALSFDLEDAIPVEGKDAARAQLADFLASDAARTSRKTFIVRVNAPDGPHFATDIAILAPLGPTLINVPKIDDAAALAAAAETLIVATASHNTETPRLLVNIETPGAVARAASIAAAHPLVAGLQVGLNDLFATLGAERHAEHVRSALWAVRLAASEAGVFAYDGAWPDLADLPGFEAEAALARSMGYLGKSCIHPSQIAAANAIFDRSNELAIARRLVDAAEAAARAGHGAFRLDGRMIDEPAIARARAVLAASAEKTA